MTVEAIRNYQRTHVDVSPDPVEDVSDFNFHGVDPDDSVRLEIKGLIHRIYEKSPDGSVIRGTIRKVKNGYKGVLRICHGGGQMIAEGIQKTADETISVLEDQIWNKIKRWRKNRFRDETA